MMSILKSTRFAALIVTMAIWPIHAASAQSAGDATASKDAALARVAFSHSLPQMDGAHLKATVVEVTYEPGGSSPPHSHPCAVIGYVIRGALRTQVRGEKEAIYKAGQSFYEAPNGVHAISANASSKVPVKFLAFFVCDHETPLSVAAPGTLANGGKP